MKEFELGYDHLEVANLDKIREKLEMVAENIAASYALWDLDLLKKSWEAQLVFLNVLSTIKKRETPDYSPADLSEAIYQTDRIRQRMKIRTQIDLLEKDLGEIPRDLTLIGGRGGRKIFSQSNPMFTSALRQMRKEKREEEGTGPERPPEPPRNPQRPTDEIRIALAILRGLERRVPEAAEVAEALRNGDPIDSESLKRVRYHLHRRRDHAAAAKFKPDQNPWLMARVKKAFRSSTSQRVLSRRKLRRSQSRLPTPAMDGQKKNLIPM